MLYYCDGFGYSRSSSGKLPIGVNLSDVAAVRAEPSSAFERTSSPGASHLRERHTSKRSVCADMR